ITQQLVKLRLLSREKTFIRKIKELILSVLVEGNYSKNQILEMYLNEVNYGGPVYGIEQAAVTFFGKNAKNLTLSQSAFLAGLPQAPSRYSPFADNLEASYARRDEVLRRMREDGYITPEQEAQAQAEELIFNNSAIKIEAPHFVMYVRQLLAEKYGEEMVNSGGLVVRTTLDLELQNQVQEIVTNEVNSLAKMRISNGAALVTNPKTGEILAMVGSKNYFDFQNDGQVNVTVRERQPGSSIKPLTYALAMETKGYSPASLILDAPITYHFKGGPDYSPKNYDGKFHGQVTLREALASSYNIPAVKLLDELGKDAEIDQAEAMGITTWEDRNRLGLSLTLGGGEVKMIDMAQLYGTFANLGLTVEEDPFLEILDYQGKTLYQNRCALFGQCDSKTKRTLSEATSYQISSVLSDNAARTPAFGPQSVLYIPGQEVAVKTGTTNNLRDNWTIGYITDRLVAVWVGNNDNQTMSYVASGITGASPIWQKIILTQLDEEKPHHFNVPTSIEKVNYCGKDEYFRAGAVPAVVCKSVKNPDNQPAEQ
ncbi:MAG: transglycosylase domain-containing protein, partial [bacterium]|nr:transglycosylase domain-containing protein [bacterium]